MKRALRLTIAGFVLAALATSVAQTPPAITQDPTNLSVSLGATATFRASNIGTSPFSYQWYYTNASTTFALDGEANPSALTNVLNLTNVRSSDAGGYYLVVTNDWGSATSRVAALTVDPTFTKITTGSIVNDLPAGRLSNDGLWFDSDNDGFLDLYVFNQEANGAATAVNFLYHNNGNPNAWLKVRLIGTASNRDAVGAKVRIQATYAGQLRWQRRDITGGDSFSGNQLYAHFGLGDATNVDVLRIEWPSGMVREFHDLAVKQFLTVTEPARLAMVQPGQLHIQCWTGMAYRIESSPDLSAWTPLATVTNLNVTWWRSVDGPERPWSESTLLSGGGTMKF